MQKDSKKTGEKIITPFVSGSETQQRALYTNRYYCKYRIKLLAQCRAKELHAT